MHNYTYILIVATLTEAIIYAGQAFYEQKDLMMFIAGKDLNALHEVIQNYFVNNLLLIVSTVH